jgi:hypothetical protein
MVNENGTLETPSRPLQVNVPEYVPAVVGVPVIEKLSEVGPYCVLLEVNPSAARSRSVLQDRASPTAVKSPPA